MLVNVSTWFELQRSTFHQVCFDEMSLPMNRTQDTDHTEIHEVAMSSGTNELETEKSVNEQITEEKWMMTGSHKLINSH